MHKPFESLMPIVLRRLCYLILALALGLALAGCGGLLNDGKASVPLSGELLAKIKAIGSSPGAPMMLRVFKQDSVMEVWKQTSAGPYALLTTYKICAWSGGFGPKVVEGDRQAPEGYYDITPALMNPYSHYYLSFNTGYPNKFDRSYGRTGSNLMVHGDCSSAGCYAMTDKEIAQIFALVRESFAGGNRAVQLEIFPFRMTPDNLAKQAGNPNMPFWQNIKTGYDVSELTKRPPTWDVCGKKYVFNSVSPDGQPLDASASCPTLKSDPALMAELSAKAAADTRAMQAEIATTGGAAVQPAATTVVAPAAKARSI